MKMETLTNSFIVHAIIGKSIDFLPFTDTCGGNQINYSVKLKKKNKQKKFQQFFSNLLPTHDNFIIFFFIRFVCLF